MTHIRSDVVVCICNPSTGQAQTVGFQGLSSQAALSRKLQVQRQTLPSQRHDVEMVDLSKCRCSCMAALLKVFLIYRNTETVFNSSRIQCSLCTTPFTPLTAATTMLAFIYCICYKSSSRTFYVSRVFLDRENAAGNKARFLQPGRSSARLSTRLIRAVLILLEHGLG